MTSSIRVTTLSPKFVRVMQELITTLFSSQSTKSKKTIQEEETDDENVMVSFA